MTETKNTVYYDHLAVASSPHLVTSLDTQKTMLWVLIALVPALIASVFYFGPRTILLTVGLSALAALLFPIREEAGHE